MKSFKILVAFAVAVFCNVAAADPYLTVGFGSSIEKTVKIIGVGTVYNDWLRLEVDYRDFSKGTHNTLTERPISGCTATTIDPCTERLTFNTKTDGIGFSALFTTTGSKEDFMYLRTGALWYRGSYKEYFASRHGVTPVSATSTTGITPFLGVGANVWRLAFEVTYYRPVYKTPDGKVGNLTSTISYKHPL